MKIFLLVLLLAASVCINALLWQRVSHLEAAAAAKDYPLGENMGYLQRYADKLWYAGEAGNWDLARYYGDEIKETAEDIIAAKVVKDDVPVSQNLQTALPPVLQRVQEAVAAHDAGQFHESYQNLVAACTACHQTAKHPFIRITIPAGAPAQWNQDFAPHP